MQLYSELSTLVKKKLTNVNAVNFREQFFYTIYHIYSSLLLQRLLPGARNMLCLQNKINEGARHMTQQTVDAGGRNVSLCMT